MNIKSTTKKKLPLNLTFDLGGEVHADDEEYYSEIDDNVKLFSRDIIYQTLYQPLVQAAYDNCNPKYENLLNMKLDKNIIIVVEPYESIIESYSFESAGTFYIGINSRISENLFTGSLYHEMFHAYQDQLGYSRFKPLNNFIMELSAIWATSFVDEDLGYHIRYSKYLYENPTLDIQNISIEETYSWYQLYYFIFHEHGDFDFINDFLHNMVNETNFETGFTKCVEEAYKLHNFMAYFGQYLFAESGLSDIPFKEGSILGDFTFDDNVLNDTDIISFAEIKDENGWCQESIDKFGYKIFHVSTEADKDAVLSIVSDIGDKESETDKKAGMIVFGKKK